MFEYALENYLTSHWSARCRLSLLLMCSNADIVVVRILCSVLDTFEKHKIWFTQRPNARAHNSFFWCLPLPIAVVISSIKPYCMSKLKTSNCKVLMVRCWPQNCIWLLQVHNAPSARAHMFTGKFSKWYIPNNLHIIYLNSWPLSLFFSSLLRVFFSLTRERNYSCIFPFLLILTIKSINHSKQRPKCGVEKGNTNSTRQM